MTKLEEGVLAQPLRRVMELSELKEGDMILMVASCTPDGEEDVRSWGSSVTTVTSSRVEDGVHCAGPTWVVRVDENKGDAVTISGIDLTAPAEGVFVSGSGYWITQIYLLLSADELQKRKEERGDAMEKMGEDPLATLDRGLEDDMVEAKKEGLEHWRGKLKEFDEGKPVNYLGERMTRDEILETIEACEKE